MSKRILDCKEVQDRFTKSTPFYPISKIILDKFKPSTDIISTFESAVEHLEDILSTQSILDEFISTSINGIVVKVKYWVDNLKFHAPNTETFITRSSQFMNPKTPMEAFESRKTYSLLITGDVHLIYSVINVMKNEKPQSMRIDLENKYNVNLPMPIGCKFDPINYYSPLNMIRTGEESDGIKGYFIVGGFLKYLNSILKKPFNQPMIQHNEFDNQKSRMECLYSAGLDYENSYYIIASMLQPKISKTRGQKKMPISDFIFSLQMDDVRMNKERVVSRKKVLINQIPIKYLFFAFGCETDREMLSYICPDMNDFGMINTIRQACLKGNSHIQAIDGIIPYSIDRGFIVLKEPLNILTARYIIGEIILSPDYKKTLKVKANNEIGVYKAKVVEDVNNILREKFMPGINRLNSNMELYNKETLTDEEITQLNKQERERNKAICFELGDIVRTLYNIGNDIQSSMDKVSLLNKRIRSGQQIEYEYKGFNNARIREIKVDIEQFIKSITDIRYFKDNQFEIRLKELLLSVVKRANDNQTTSLLNSFKGAVTKDKSKIRTQLANTKNQVFMDSMIREIVIGADKGLKASHDDVQWEHRVVHPSHLYFIDPCYTPEGGKSVGKNQQPTLYTYLTNGNLGKDVYEYIKSMKGYLSYVGNIDKNYIIKLNGSTIGYVEEFDNVEKMYLELMKARQLKKITHDCSVTLKHVNGTLDIWTDEGRLMNHFINVENVFDFGKIDSKQNTIDIKFKKDFVKWVEDCQNCGNINLNKQDIKLENIEDYKKQGVTELVSEKLYNEGLIKGFITLMDPTMVVYNAVISPTIQDFYKDPFKYNYVALPLQTLSYVSAINPSLALNAGVRCSYCSNHVKQAIGPTLRYPETKYINELNTLVAPQIPFIRPCSYDFLHYNEKPMGNNITIAFLMFTDNQEDSFIMNRESIENGVLCIDSLFTYFADTTKKLDETFKIPDPITLKSEEIKLFDKIDSNSCLPKRVGERFYKDDVVISKVVKLTQQNKTTETNKSVINEKLDAFHPRESCTRELRYCYDNETINKNQFEKMATFKQRRVPITGDKFNSTNAQKGTLGKIYNTDKMPFTTSGIIPDIIFNPPSIFKRNTCGQIYEPSISKLCALLCCPLDTTPYSTYRSTEEIDYIYEKLGLDKFGYEDLYDPESGRLMGKVFIGTIQQQRQQHLVENKLNVRNGTGDVDKISGLAVKGRKKSGGQSVDRMSNDAINASGAVILNKYLHLEQGAKTTIAFCKHCHKQYTYFSKEYQCWFCVNCGRHNDFIIKEIPPIQPLINQVMTGLHIIPEYKEEEKNTGIISTLNNKYYDNEKFINPK